MLPKRLLLFRRKLALELLFLLLLLFLKLRLVESEIVDRDFVGRFGLLALADDGLKVVELLEVELAERHQLRVVVNRRIVKAIANRSHHEDVL